MITVERHMMPKSKINKAKVGDLRDEVRRLRREIANVVTLDPIELENTGRAQRLRDAEYLLNKSEAE